MKCNKCGLEQIGNCPPSNHFHEHHLVPKFMFDNKKDADSYGRIILCKKCHDILHFILGKWIFNYVVKEVKKNCRLYIKQKSLAWIGKEVDNEYTK